MHVGKFFVIATANILGLCHAESILIGANRLLLGTINAFFSFDDWPQSPLRAAPAAIADDADLAEWEEDDSAVLRIGHYHQICETSYVTEIMNSTYFECMYMILYNLSQENVQLLIAAGVVVPGGVDVDGFWSDGSARDDGYSYGNVYQAYPQNGYQYDYWVNWGDKYGGQDIGDDNKYVDRWSAMNYDVLLNIGGEPSLTGKEADRPWWTTFSLILKSLFASGPSASAADACGHMLRGGADIACVDGENVAQ